jgi:hypothetical protein
MLEREIRSVSAPIITTDPNVELGLEFKPGRIYQVGADVNQYKELQINPASASYWNALTSLQGIINRSGSGGTSPIMPSRQPRSATEKAGEFQREKEAAGLYYLFYEDLMEQIAWLVIQNMIQFYTAKKTEKILGSRKFHKVLNMIDVQLAKGGMGNRYVRITDTPATANELKDEAWYRSMFKKERAEIIEVSPKTLRQMKFDIKIEFEPDESPDSDRAMFIDFTKTLVGLFGPYGLLDPKKMLFRTIEKFGENISDYIPDNLVSEYEQERFGMPVNPMMGMPMGGTPEVNKYTQANIGQQFGAQGPATRQNNEGILTPIPEQQPTQQ